MSYNLKYRKLFQVKVPHCYFLNKGKMAFSSMEPEEKLKQLNAYDFHSVFSVRPTKETKNKLNGHGLILKKSQTGFVVLTKMDADDQSLFVELADDLALTFFLEVQASFFFNYTNLELTNARAVYYFSNRKLLTDSSLPLITHEGNDKYVSNEYILSEEGKKNELKYLGERERGKIFGIIRVFMKGDTPSLNVTVTAGKIPEEERIFIINFENRRTFWRYVFTTNQSEISTSDDVEIEEENPKILITKQKQPLTESGFVSVKLNDKFLPNPDARRIKPDKTSNAVFSEIYM